MAYTYSSEADHSIVALIDAYITAYSEPAGHSIYTISEADQKPAPEP